MRAHDGEGAGRGVTSAAPRHLSSASVFLASSWPLKTAGDPAAKASAFRATSLSPVLAAAIPR